MYLLWYRTQVQKVQKHKYKTRLRKWIKKKLTSSWVINNVKYNKYNNNNNKISTKTEKKMNKTETN